MTGYIYYSQRDYADVPYPSPVLPEATVASGGCGVCSASMIVENLTRSAFPPKEAARFSMQNGGRVIGGTDMRALGAALCREFDLTLTHSDSEDELVEHITAGGMAIANTGGDRPGYTGVFSAGGHFIVIAARRGDELTVLDPACYPGKFSIGGRAGKVRAGADGEVFVRPGVLAEDCKYRWPRYYLFAWRGGETAETEKDNLPADWEREAVEWAQAAGVLQGAPDGDLKLHAPLTRAEACVLLMRAVGLRG